MGAGRRLTRRQLLAWTAGGAAAVVAAGAGVLELVDHDVLPGHALLDQIDGACTVPGTTLRFSPTGPTVSGQFTSRARRRTVDYVLAYPPGHGPGSHLPLVVALHAYGASYANPLAGMSLAQGAALHVGGRPLPPMAFVSADGGNGYWNPHPGDDPMAMVVDELVPMCRARGLGQDRVGIVGVSMGGYGALLLGERYPAVFDAVAAVSPAVWTSYGQARAANAGAYASAADFAADDVVTHADRLRGRPVRVASGDQDPFHPGVVALAQALPPGAVVVFGKGCHDGGFFTEQEPPSLAFLADHLT